MVEAVGYEPMPPKRLNGSFFDFPHHSGDSQAACDGFLLRLCSLSPLCCSVPGKVVLHAEAALFHAWLTNLISGLEGVGPWIVELPLRSRTWSSLRSTITPRQPCTSFSWPRHYHHNHCRHWLSHPNRPVYLSNILFSLIGIFIGLIVVIAIPNSTIIVFIVIS